MGEAPRSSTSKLYYNLGFEGGSAKVSSKVTSYSLWRVSNLRGGGTFTEVGLHRSQTIKPFPFRAKASCPFKVFQISNLKNSPHLPKTLSQGGLGGTKMGGAVRARAR